MKNSSNIRNTAIALLARREHSEQELCQKLLKRGFDSIDINNLIPVLVAEKLISNSRFIESYIHHRRQKGYGPLRISQELQLRGISEDLIEHHLDIADNAWLVQAHKTWQKRFKGIVPCNFKERAQQIRFLQYRGFTSEQIEKIYDRH